MKKNGMILAVAAIVFGLAGCNNNDNESVADAKYITVNTSIGSLSRTTVNAQGVQEFVKDDKISVYAWTGTAASVATDALVVNNAINTYDGAKWVAAPQMLWKDMITPHFFVACYPQKAITNFTTDTYTLNVADQESSDLLVAVNKGAGDAGFKATASSVALQFDHVMSKLIVNLSFRNQWATTPTVEAVKATAKTGATVDYLSKTATAQGDAAPVALAVTTANAAYHSIMVPQSISTILITIGDKDYTYTNAGGIVLEPGKYTTVNLIVGRDQIDLGSVTINNWGEGDVINGGEALD